MVGFPDFVRVFLRPFDEFPEINTILLRPLVFRFRLPAEGAGFFFRRFLGSGFFFWISPFVFFNSFNHFLLIVVHKDIVFLLLGLAHFFSPLIMPTTSLSLANLYKLKSLSRIVIPEYFAIITISPGFGRF